TATIDGVEELSADLILTKMSAELDAIFLVIPRPVDDRCSGFHGSRPFRRCSVLLTSLCGLALSASGLSLGELGGIRLGQSIRVLAVDRSVKHLATTFAACSIRSLALDSESDTA